MFWAGTRRIDEGVTTSAGRSRRTRARDLIATGVMAIALVGLVVPTVDTAAAAPPAGRTLIAGWAQSFRTTTYQETSRKVSYRGRWLVARHGGYLGGAVRSSDTAQATVSIAFTGSGISWIGSVGPTRGKAAVFIDGKRVATVDTYKRRFQPARELFTTTFAKPGKHRLTIRVLGTKGRPTVAVDSFVVRGEPRGTSSKPEAPRSTPAPSQPAAPTKVPTPAPTAAGATVPAAAPTAALTPAPTPEPTATPAPVANAMPSTDLPGWDLVFRDDFSTTAAEGQFLAKYPSWRAYPSGWKDSSGFGTYDPKILSTHDGVLDVFIRSEAGKNLVASFGPVLANGSTNQLYGRYAIRFRADAIVGYKGAWLLWPKSEVWPRDGEINFPEGDFDRTIDGFVHRQGASSGSDQAAFSTGARWTTWHTAVVEWKPGSVQFFLDGTSVGRTTERVPNTPMHWQIQNETRIVSNAPPASSAGHVTIDWVAVWSYAP